MLVGKKCANCGKLIFPTPIWVYQKYDKKSGGKRFYCSWSCYRGGRYKYAQV